MGKRGALREANSNWRGGRSITSHGYVLIRVGVGHHLADVRGYAYEHRLRAEEKLGRRLLPGEEVHHRDDNKKNNSSENLDPKASKAEHRIEHRKPGSMLRLPGQDNPIIACACGCGRTFEQFDSFGRPRSFVSGHNIHPAGRTLDGVQHDGYPA